MCSRIVTPNKCMTASTKSRYATYTVILIYSILICAWSIMNAVYNGPSGTKLVGMGIVVAIFSVLVFGWTFILYRFNNSPQSEHKFSRIRTHVYSLVMIAVIMIVVTIPLFTQIPNQCEAKNYSDGKTGLAFHCTWLCVLILYSWICALFAGLIAFFIRRRAIRSNYDMDTINIALIVDPTTTREAAT